MKSSAAPARGQIVTRIGLLEGMRGYLALWVLVVHVGYFVGLSRFEGEKMFPGFIAAALSYFDLTVYDAVKLFMILSGFVIFYLLDQGKESYWGFLVRRFFRLWPLFMVCVCLGVVTNGIYIECLRDNPWSHNFWIHRQLGIAEVIQTRPLPYFLFEVFMLNGQIPKFILENAASAFTPLAWCISTEWFFYVLAPLFYQLTKKPVGTAVLAVAVLIALACENYYGFWINPVHSFLPLQIHWFFTGLVSYLIYRDVRMMGLDRRNRWKLALLGGFIIVATALHPREGLGLWLWLPIFAALVTLAVGRTNPLTSLIVFFFDNPVSRYFGRISYSVYLLHWPVTVLAVRSLMKFAPQISWQIAEIATLVVVALVTLPLSHLTYKWIEVPAMDLGKRLAANFPRRTEMTASAPLPRPLTAAARK